MNRPIQYTHQRMIGLFLLLASVLPGTVAQAQIGSVSITITVRISRTISSDAFKCIPIGFEDMVLVEGAGEGFEVDEDLPVEEILTAIDIAHQLMRGELHGSNIGYIRGDSVKREVLKAFETHLEDQPEDWYSMREYGIALLWDHQYEAGAQALLLSYQGDPSLVRIAFDEHIFGEGAGDLGKLSQELVRHARREQSAMSWFAMAVILQGKGDYAHALSSLERAKDFGLDEVLGASMETSLRASKGE